MVRLAGWVLLLLFVLAAQAKTKMPDPWQAYREHRWQAAEDALAGVRTWRAQMAAGIAAYHLKAWARAMQHFRQASWWALNDRQRAQALYNLGLSFIQLEQYGDAVETFAAALRYQPDFPLAQQNLKLARQLLAAHRPPAQKQDLGRKKLEDNFAFAGGRKPVISDKNRSEWDNRIATRHDRGPNLIDSRSGLGAPPRTPLAQIQRVTQLAPLEKARLVERFTQQLSQLEDSQWAVQMRLFEREEGFEAAQKAPHDIKGAAPW